MPTPAERKAILFFAALAVLGAGVRMARAARGAPAPEAGSRRALAAQLARVDSARAAARGAAAGKGAARPERGRRAARRASGAGADGDTASRRAPPPLAPTPARPLDLDVATALEIEGLPGVGAVLAGRIVARRARCGGLGALAALDAVEGVGPKLLERLRPLVTFSRTRRPTDTGPARCEGAADGASSRAGGSARHSARAAPGTTFRSGARTRANGRAAGRATDASRRGVSP